MLPMLGISRLRNPIQTYAWGSRTGIATFLGQPSPAAEPQAELWMGAHPTASSEVEIDGCWVSLADAIAADPEAILGTKVVARHGAELPFLFKVLAAGGALSIQAHPDRDQADDGFRRENDLGIPHDAPTRNYRDRNHKPEVLYAVTPFAILRGFRPAAEILELLQPLDLPRLLPEADTTLRAGDLEGFFRAYMSIDCERLRAVLARTLEAIEARAASDEAFSWVAKLEQRFPADRGVLAPLFLALLELSPGEAIFTGPGVLHAYLEGLGIELMANSDNVIRGGLTPKHVDVPELLRILRFEPEPPTPLSLSLVGGERRLETGAAEFDLSVVDVAPGEVYRKDDGGVGILLCSRGQGFIRPAEGTKIAFAQGDSMLVPAATGGYLIQGDATLFRAGVPTGDRP